MAFKRVATEGATTDGRNISRAWLEQIANNYDPNKYGARIWNEHMRGLLADSPFPALGDVKAVKLETNAEGKLELHADLDPTDQLKAINGQRQKVYTSIEVDPDFAGSGEAYLVGLAVTDSPASLGTEMLRFSQQQGANSPLRHHKQRPENVFTASIEMDLDFTADDIKDQKSLVDKLRARFNRQDKKTAEGDKALRDEVEGAMNEFADQHDKLNGRVEQTATELAQIKTKVDAIYAALDAQPDQPIRKHATGGNGAVVETDC